jgi:hypothetical protein
LLAEVAKGADPAADKRESREAMTVGELCDSYLADADAGRLLTRRGNAKKASTLTIDRGRIERHVKPLLGRVAVSAVERRDIERFMHAVAEGKTAGRTKTRPRGLARVRGGKGTATRAVGLLGGIFTYAVRHDNIEAIYKKLEERRDTADVSDLLKELHRIVNEAIRAAYLGGHARASA